MNKLDQRSTRAFDWLCVLTVALLSCLAGVVLDYFARGALSYVKTGLFEVYISGALYKVFIGMVLLGGGVTHWLAGHSSHVMFLRRIATILSAFCIVGFGLLLLMFG